MREGRVWFRSQTLKSKCVAKMPSEPLTRGVIFSWTICVGLACQLLAGARGQDLFTCGWDEVRALRIVGTNITVLWKWTASNSNLPEWTWPLFATTDDCKPYGDGRVVITSSGGDSMNGGVAVVQVQTTQAVFYARAANAHSADLLPRDRIAVALSYQTNGNRLVVFDLSRPDTELFSTELRGGPWCCLGRPTPAFMGTGRLRNPCLSAGELGHIESSTAIGLTLCIAWDRWARHVPCATFCRAGSNHWLKLLVV